MSQLSSLRGIVSILLVLAGLWVLFLIAAHLILDIEQGKKYIESLRLTQFGYTSKESMDDTLYFESTEGKKSTYLNIFSLQNNNCNIDRLYSKAGFDHVFVSLNSNGIHVI